MSEKSPFPAEMLDPRGPLHGRLLHELPGLRIHERDVLVSNGTPERRAHWAGTDADGRLALVLFARPDDALPAWVLTALSWAADARPVVARRWEQAELRVDLDPRVIVVATGFTLRSLRALGFLDGCALDLFECSTVDGSQGQQPFLVRAHAGRSPRAETAGEPFAGWPAAARGPLARLARDLSRVDPELELRDLGDVVRWTWRGEDVARVEERDGETLVVESRGRSTASLADPERTEAWIERFLLAHCLGRVHPLAAERPLALLDRSNGPLLSDEELAAFRD